MVKYFWVRIFDYKYSDELAKDAETDDYSSFEAYKGVLLDEYYLCDENMTREYCKDIVKNRSNIERFAKSRNKTDCIYALVLDSDKFFYDRFYTEIDTFCLNCHRPIEGKAMNFPSIIPYRYDESILNEIDGLKEDTKMYLCSHDCKREIINKLSNEEGDWQERTGYDTNGGVYGYIYHIYNRIENKHYIGQSIYMPFFRWQEHVKSGLKGNICDLVFETIAEVKVKSAEYLNSVEAWWIKKYIHDYGEDCVFNISNPRITIQSLLDSYYTIVDGKILSVE